MTLAVFVVGHMSADLWLLTRQLPGALTRTVVAVVYVVHDLAIPGAAVGWAVLYAFAIVVVVLFLANLRFRGKDLK